MQYYKPSKAEHFFGDAMPFFDGRRFHVYYLRDVNHLQAGHVYSHISSADLRRWDEHPTALELGEHPSYGTGSVWHHENRYYAFFSASVRSSRNTIIGLAQSEDGLQFHEVSSARFPDVATIEAFGYKPWQYRDPCVFRDPETGLFHMLVTSALQNGFDGTVYPFGGCLAHLTSPDLLSWELHPPFLVPGKKGAPECPDHFEWNGWYYLFFSHEGVTHYRMARAPLGPWQKPEHDMLTTEMERVMKTAAFHGNRRIGVSFAPTVQEAGPLYGGRAVFRELVQMEDGTLGTAFPDEMRFALQEKVFGTPDLTLNTPGGCKVVPLGTLPGNATITARIEPSGRCEAYGLLLKGIPSGEALELAFVPGNNQIELRDTMKRWPFCRGYTLNKVRAHIPLNHPFELTVVLHGNIVDVNINGRQCFFTTFPRFEDKGACFAYALNSVVSFRNIEGFKN